MSEALLILAAAGTSPAGLVLVAGVLLLLVVLSGAFSGSETVLFSLTRVQLEQCRSSTNPFCRLAARLMARPQDTLMTILLCNTAVNVLLFAISYVFFRRLAEQCGAWVTPVAAAASILLVVVGGEVVPKVLAVTFAERLAPFSATLVQAVGIVAGPVGRLIDGVIARPFARLLLGRRAEAPAPAHDLSAAELKALLYLSRRRGGLDPLEDRFLQEIIDLGATRVRDVMVPRVEVVAYDINGSPDGLRMLMRRTRLKKVPVYEGSIDHIVGLVYAKMLFLEPEQPLRDLLVPVHFVPELATCEHLLHHFRQTRTQLAIAVDEFGGVAGLVTLEDVLEEIVGELSDPEEQPAEPDIVPLSEREYEISGRLDVRYWAETFGLPRQTERVTTVGGLVTARLGRPARVGDVIRLGNVELRVIEVGRRRVTRLRLRLLTPEEGAEGGR